LDPSECYMAPGKLWNIFKYSIQMKFLETLSNEFECDDQTCQR
jgi:hypothetical protein